MTLLAPSSSASLANRLKPVRLWELNRTWPRFFPATWVVVGLLAMIGLGLRLVAARGDLWLDELWSLDLVSRISSADQVFWDIPHDNNHLLNSLWMFLVGQDASPLAYRLPSVVFGTVTIVVAGWLGARTSAAAAIAASTLATFSYALVDYGSEARGYAGLILAVLLSIGLNRAAIDRLLASTEENGTTMDTSSASRTRWLLGATILFGVCSHLTMLAAAAILSAATVVRLVGAGVKLRTALDETVALFRPSLLLVLPVIAALGAGTALHQGYTVGGYVPFTVGHFLGGYGGLVAMLLGVPIAVPSGFALVLAAVILVVALRMRLLGPHWLALVLVALLVWPAIIFAARIPNTEYPRYFLSAGLVLPIALAEITGVLWKRGRAGRLVAVCGIAAISAGQVPYLRQLIVDHRGTPSAAVALMSREGPTTFMAQNPEVTVPVVDVYAARLGVHLTLNGLAEGCRMQAPWFIADADYAEPEHNRLAKAEPACAALYIAVATFPTAPWSGQSWTIYHREP